jgi:hypothetical protein
LRWRPSCRAIAGARDRIILWSARQRRARHARPAQRRCAASRRVSEIDSTIATASDPAPSIDRILGFDEDAGQVSFVDSRGLPGRIDFRFGNVSRATRTKLRELGSADGSTIYGIDPNGDVVRLTPDGDWSFKPPRPARMVFPVRDGTVLVVGGEKENTVLWRLRPPETTVVDSLALGPVSKPTATQTGDRVYLLSGEDALVGISTRVLRKGAEIRLDHGVAALVGTPSGDRLYVATDFVARVGGDRSLPRSHHRENRVPGSSTRSAH